MSAEVGRGKNLCRFWLPKKNRFCANLRSNQSLFCGNHKERPCEHWIQCPIDPSHSVLEVNLKGHLRRCPLFKHTQFMKLQPFYEKGINGGGSLDGESEEVRPLNCTSDYTKRSAVHRLTVHELSDLISKIKSIHMLLCNDIFNSNKISEACGRWINGDVDRRLPFQEKHVLQQASILGNLEDFGVISPNLEDTCQKNEDDNCANAVVEFGAGRGYLTQMLADCYGIKRVYLVERKSCKLKADRSLRQKDNLILERLKIDIEDLNLNAVESLKGAHYLAIGKHLCGSATDLTLRCCVPRSCEQSSEHHDKLLRLKGLAITTCCHHLCEWKHYINKGYFLSMGINEDHFNAISWLTSWAVDADHCADLLPDTIDLETTFMNINEKGSEKVEEFAKGMEPIQRAVLGFMCKEIIDNGRLMWLREQGFDATFVKYVPSNVSPENHLLMAKATCSNRTSGLLGSHPTLKKAIEKQICEVGG